ncbi:carbonic anhydrase 4-like [Xenopus laevis]|uniref:Carbonic anhydrase n=1 Tax=Xenopus laevis TaxID=8355 RepID=A0A8J1M848_XENLA|nr:carbonic anhydrase 4-like [Xenopus laevis]
MEVAVLWFGPALLPLAQDGLLSLKNYKLGNNLPTDLDGKISGKKGETIQTKTYLLYLESLFRGYFLIFLAESSWCYEVQVCSTGCKGPRNWKHIYSECGGSQQSPVNIMTKNTTYNSLLRPFQFKGYNVTHALPITNNGHSAQVDLPTDAQISGGGLVGVYEAKQLHFHWGSADIAGSEHTIDGERYLMELHVVHRRKAIKEENISISKGDMAVLGFFFEVSPYFVHLNQTKSFPNCGQDYIVRFFLK